MPLNFSKEETDTEIYDYTNEELIDLENEKSEDDNYEDDDIDYCD